MKEKAPSPREPKARKSFMPSLTLVLLAGLAGCSADDSFRAPDDAVFAAGTEGGATALVLDGRKVVFDRDAHARERLRELAGDDDPDDTISPLRSDCDGERQRLGQDLALRASLGERGIAIESLDITIVGERRRLKRGLGWVEPEA